MAKDPAYFVAAIRQLANVETDPIVSDAEVLQRANEGLAGLYDILVGAYERYNVRTYDFTLAGGVGGNTVALPWDFYKDAGLDKDPTSTPKTVNRIAAWIERNNLRRRGYDLDGANLIVLPATLAVGNFRLHYTPTPPILQNPTVVTVAYPTVNVSSAGGAADGTLHNWFFPAGAFDSTYVGRWLYMTGCSNSGNNGFKQITSVPDATDLRTVGYTTLSESFGGGVTAKVFTGPIDSVSYSGSNVWGFHGLDTSLLEVGSTITVAGSASSDGTYTVLTIFDAHTVTTDGAPKFETFAPGVTVTFQEKGTAASLPPIFTPWYEYIEVAGAIAVKDKIEQDTVDLEARLSRLTARITAAATNRMDEGGQVGLPRQRGNFWDDDAYPFGG